MYLQKWWYLNISHHSSAWFLDRTLQSNMALLAAGLALATLLPTLTGWSRVSVRSWNGCELGRQQRVALGKGPPSSPLPEEEAVVAAAAPAGTGDGAADDAGDVSADVAGVEAAEEEALGVPGALILTGLASQPVAKLV